MQIDSHEVHPYKGAHKDKGNTDGNDIAALAPHGKKAHNKDDEDGFIEPSVNSLMESSTTLGWLATWERSIPKGSSACIFAVSFSKLWPKVILLPPSFMEMAMPIASLPLAYILVQAGRGIPGYAGNIPQTEGPSALCNQDAADFIKGLCHACNPNLDVVPFGIDSSCGRHGRFTADGAGDAVKGKSQLGEFGIGHADVDVHGLLTNEFHFGYIGNGVKLAL